MNVEDVAHALRLDHLAVIASRALAAADVPHVLLKGPTTANWLYDPPRPYADVDLMVPSDLIDRAADVLTAAAVAARSAGRAGEAAAHSLSMQTTAGLDLDLHLTLPTMTYVDASADGPLWSWVSEHRVLVHLADHAVPALDEHARGVVVALHALTNPRDSVAAEDLRRVLALGQPFWSSVLAAARVIGAEAAVVGARSRARGEHLPPAIPLSSRMLAEGGSGAFRLARIAELPAKQRPRALLQGMFPSAPFMEATTGHRRLRGLPLVVAHVRRLRRVVREMPAIVAALRAARRRGH